MKKQKVSGENRSRRKRNLINMGFQNISVWKNGIETCIISCMKQVASQVQCTILDAWGWCTGTTQREGMGREEGGGFRMRNTGIPVADSFRYLAKLIQYCKV